MNPPARAVMTASEVARLLDEVFPEIHDAGRIFEVEAIRPLGASLRMRYHPRNLRPGGTISGPAMFTLADLAMYAAVLGAIGPVPLAVTTNLNINFLRKPPARDMIADVRLLKLGQRLAIGEVSLFGEGVSEPAAHATATYSIPPPSKRVGG
ncbi:MAG: phenylacetic acid degradation protein [Rhizobiales bacterium]|nr:phenylacetic acid degradation protein [Hyphomicrobiales bacterium]